MSAPRKRSAARVPPSIIAAMDDPALFGAWFKAPSWQPWRSFLRVAFALPLSEGDIELFRQCTGRQTPAAEATKEIWVLAGRRGGKSLISSLLSCYLVLFYEYRDYLAPGERATVMLLAGDRRQARTLMRYCKGLVKGSPILARKIENETAESLDFTNRTTIEVSVANPRATRGYTLAGIITDEIATWPSDELSPKRDEDTLAALRPAMLTIPHAKMVAITSPYARKGAVWNAYRKHFGKDESKVLIWQASTEVMNPSVDRDFIAAAYEDDPASAAAEFGAQFRTDVGSYITREVLDACVVPGRHELPPVPGVHYQGFADPSGGSSDSFTLAIAHADGERIVLDAVREARPPFSPEAVTAEFAVLLKAYGLSSVRGDRYAGEWPRERFREHGIEYEISELSKSDIYRELIPKLNAHRVELLDHARLAAQFLGLERRTGRGTGRDIIDHGPNAHDDIANAACGALLACGTDDALAVWLTLAQQAEAEERAVAAKWQRAAEVPPPAPNGFWDVAARKFHHGEPPAGTVRVSVKGHFGLALAYHVEPLKFMPGLNDMDAALLDNPTVLNYRRAGNLTIIETETK